jgi:hypothetical protein
MLSHWLTHPITDIKAALAEIRKVIGEIPILASEQVSVREGWR